MEEDLLTTTFDSQRKRKVARARVMFLNPAPFAFTFLLSKRIRWEKSCFEFEERARLEHGNSQLEAADYR